MGWWWFFVRFAHALGVETCSAVARVAQVL
jgi:hypothetical protein